MVLVQPGGEETTFPVLLRDKSKQAMYGREVEGVCYILYAFEMLRVAAESGVMEGDVIPPQFKSPAWSPHGYLVCC